MNVLSKVVFISSLLAVTPFVAAAQSTTSMTSTITLGYGQSSLDFGGTDIDMNTLSFNFSSDITFSPRFTLGFDVGFSQSSVDVPGGGPDIDLDLTRLAFEPTYSFGNGFNAGLYYQRGDVDVSGIGIPFAVGVDLNSYGLILGYENGPWEATLHYGRTDIDPGLLGVDFTDYGIAASYEISSNFEVFGQISRTDINTGGPSADLTLIALGADYQFANGLSVFGALSNLDVGGIPVDARQIALGLAYDIGQSGSGIPVTLSLEVARTNIDVLGSSADVNHIGVGLTIPIGNGASSDPLNTRARAARGDYHTALFSGPALFGF